MSESVLTSNQSDHAVKQVRRYYDLVDRGDVLGLVNLFTDEAVYCRPGYEPLVGHRDLTRFYEADRVIEEGRHTLVELVADASSVAVKGEFNGRLKDGRQVSLRFADFFTLDASLRFARRDTYFFAPMV